MIRELLTPRTNWRETCEALGFPYHSIDGIYWDERYCYRFTEAEIDQLEEATADLHSMALEVVAHVVEQKRFQQFAIPQEFWRLITESWRRGDVSVLGRFDLSWGGVGSPKLLEYNADTPTALLEASVVQWQWLEELRPQHDQFNSIHEKLIAVWKRVIKEHPDTVLYFSCIKDHEEEFYNLEYLRDTAIQASWPTKFSFIEDIGWDSQNFVDISNANIDVLFKLYPWEWLIAEAFGPKLLQTPISLIEPPWKMILSNKALLPLLWELFPNHPNLLPAYFDSWRVSGEFVKKPIFSREGENVTIYAEGRVVHEPGKYGKEGFIYQAYAPLPRYPNVDGEIPFDYASIGSWVIAGQPAGIGVRVDESPITKNTSRFCPHYFVS